MALLRTSQIARGILLGARVEEQVYKVPIGWRAVIRDFYVVNEFDNDPTSVAATVSNSGGGGGVYLFIASLEVAGTYRLPGGAVLMSDQELWLYSTYAPLHYFISGAVLPEPSPGLLVST